MTSKTGKTEAKKSDESVAENGKDNSVQEEKKSKLASSEDSSE